MNIALAQMRVKAGQIDLNLAEIKRNIDSALAQKADLIVFPEMAVTGYLISDAYLQRGFVEEALEANEQIRSWSKDIGIIWGNLDSDLHAKVNRDGRHNRLNTAFFAHHGQWVPQQSGLSEGRYVKHCLPDYRFFDDSRYFKSGMDLAIERHLGETDLVDPFLFTLADRSYRIGLEVCEDLWSKDYRIDPTALLIQKGAELIINISTSPWTLHKEASRTKRILEHVATHQERMVPLIYLNACGIQNNGKNVLVFDGGSTFYGKDGSVQVGLRDDFQAELKVVALDHKEAFIPTPNKLFKALVHAIRLFDEEILGARLPWIIGLSGGIDSSVNAALLTLALGKERVRAYNMASRFNSDQTKSVARQLAQALNLRFEEGSIESLVEATQSTLKHYGYELTDSGLSFENTQARLRGHLLSSFASMEGGVICNNGNKVELALGYATLYGDTIGALSPLGDLTKLQIFDLAHEINAHFGKTIIDESLIPSVVEGVYAFKLPPSAELKEKQVDPMKWGYHDWLVQYLTEYPSHSLVEWLRLYKTQAYLSFPVSEVMKAHGLENPKRFVEDIRWFMKAFHAGIFKRIQFPPIVTLSRGSFGYDYRESQIPYVESREIKTMLEHIEKGGVS